MSRFVGASGGCNYSVFSPAGCQHPFFPHPPLGSQPPMVPPFGHPRFNSLPPHPLLREPRNQSRPHYIPQDYEQPRNMPISKSSHQRQEPKHLSLYRVLFDLLLKPEEIQQRDALRRRLDQELEGASKGPAELRIYGSSINLIGMSGCDLDLAFFSHQQWSKAEIQKTISFVTKKLRQSRTGYNFDVRRFARKPIVKFIDTATKLECDIGFLSMNDLSVFRMASLIRQYAHMDERVHCLLVAVKYWSIRRSLCDAPNGGMSALCLTVMVLHFCITSGVVPCVDSSQLIEFGEAILDAPAAAPLLRSSPYFTKADGSPVQVLLRRFFAAYSNDVFRTKRHVLTADSDRDSVASLWTVAKSAEWKDRWPNLAVRDPFDPSNNLARSISAAGYRLMEKEFRRAAELTKSGSFDRTSEVFFTQVCAYAPQSLVSPFVSGTEFVRGGRKRRR